MAERNQLPVGVFDSGMGGVSVLIRLHQLMPEEDFLFFGDSANAPYGVRPMEEVRRLAMAAAEKLIAQGVKALVVACNTATSAAITSLREKYPELPVIGLEPAIKPAALENPGGRVLVLATSLTISLPKCHRLVEAYEDQAQLVPVCMPGEVVEYVERDMLGTPELQHCLRETLSPYFSPAPDAVVLGCTHYPFLKADLSRVLPCPVRFYDGGPGTARETLRRLEESGLRNTPGRTGTITFTNSAGEGAAALSRRLFETGLD